MCSNTAKSPYLPPGVASFGVASITPNYEGIHYTPEYVVSVLLRFLWHGCMVQSETAGLCFACFRPSFLVAVRLTYIYLSAKGKGPASTSTGLRAVATVPALLLRRSGRPWLGGDRPLELEPGNQEPRL